MIPEFFSRRPEWADRIERIGELLGRVSVFEEMAPGDLEPRRANRIASVHSSTAIEGNRLTLSQVSDLADGVPVFAPPRAVLEVENALAAYDALDSFDPWSVDDLLRAHGLLTVGLVGESGAFRRVDVEIVGADGTVLHTGSRAEKVPRLVRELLEWGSGSSDHPLVVSSAVHYLIEPIRPFRDGNGRIGRLWQTLILSSWRPVFAWMPTETLIRRHQAGYYDALQASHEPEIDAAPFIEYMLDVIGESLGEYESQARRQDVGVNVGINVGVKARVIDLLRSDSTLSAATLADLLGKTARTAERHLSQLKAEGRVRRVGPPKTGRWVVVEDPDE
ncbi:MAG TPA: Fic family protein [Arachnia sp.]|nr:Fic family protein [Arachnia sp.]